MDNDDIELRVGLPLPRSVEQLLHKICSEKNQSPPKADVRRKLVVAGEKEALRVLQIIDRNQVRNLSAYISYMLRNSSSPSPPPTPSPPPSPFPSPSHSLSSSRSPPPPKRVSVSYSPIQRISSSSTPPSGSIPCSLSAQTETPTKARERGQREALEALGELEFRKQFLILNYIAGNELQAVITDEEIRRLKDVAMVEFEKHIWKRFGRNFLDPQDRLMYHDWDSRRTHLYYCHVSPEGSYRFKGPYLNNTRTHLQKVLGDDNVLMVKFAEESTSHDPNYPGFTNLCKEGILVGLRLYCYYVFKDGGKEEKKKSPTSSPVKCFFIRTHSNAHIDQNASYILSDGSYRTMFDRRLLFMHAHTVSNVAKFMARFSLILSKTHSLDIDLSQVQVDIIKDIPCQNEFGDLIYRDGEPLIHTDGSGYISEDLALLCPKNVHKGQYINDKFSEIIQNHDGLDDKVENGAKVERQGSGTEEPPMLIQFRMFYNGYAVKGTFLVNKKLQDKTIQIRESMVKVKPDPDILNIKTVNSLEVVGTSNPPNKTYTSRNLIALLSYGGVPHKYFEELLENALREAYGAFSSKRTALKVGIIYGNMDSDFTIARMILSGIPLEEPYLQYRLSVLMKEEKKSLKGGKLYIPECYYLMGTADPTGKLESDEVCIVLHNGQISGKVLVYRNPGIHFGDIHVLKATYIEELESFVGNAKYAIFFSTKGPRSVADEIAGGDFDGDMYWVSRNPELLKYFKPSEPWVPIPSTKKVVSKPIPSSPEDLEYESIKHFLQIRFNPSNAMSEAADSWLALMDRYLILGNDCVEEKNLVRKNIVKLINIYYDALDAAKNGIKVVVPRELKPKKLPHYMERQDFYESKSILGLIYDRVNSYKEEDYSNTEVWKLPCFDVDIISEDSLKKWKELYNMYREEMCDALNNKDNEVKNNAADEVKMKYKKLLYGAEDLEESPRNMEEIYNEAIAIYHLSYDYAMSGRGSVKNCSFAWNVAGSALFKFHAIKKIGEKAFFCVPSVLKEVL
ncbi:probable RNA-dependent RNA polymerase 5 isoform X2 [Humulus lupulus]|uniref:probable RNA-dependent RNA polymerase 5 isoform X2 n=1 Tax=Humulus lupulus TaxID=3486 RepID=UPI002B40B138|nr:probable RNA-dependent RNA polymerase 5 isoform X2 [Humulus lupulus]